MASAAEVTTKCTFSPCEYSNPRGGIPQHVSDHHVEVSVTDASGSFKGHGIPVFLEKKPMLRCSRCEKLCGNRKMLKKHFWSMKCRWFVTEEGLKMLAALTQDKDFGAAASALLKKHSAEFTDLVQESSSPPCPSDEIRSLVVAVVPEGDNFVPSSQNRTLSGCSPAKESLSPAEKRPFSPNLISSISKRSNLPLKVLSSRYEEGVLKLDIDLKWISPAFSDGDVHAETSAADSLSSLLVDSPCARILSESSWVEFPAAENLPDDWSNIISGDWFDNRLMNYVVAVLFSGCVLFNPANGFSLIGLVVESYGRGICVDIHSEKPVPVGESVTSMSQPPSFGRYPHACVFHIFRTALDQRLVIGFKLFNILITECWRLDRHVTGSRAFTGGLCATSFPIEGEGIRIFVDKRSFLLASDILSGKFVPKFGLEKLRQIRSHMCSMDSYRMGRASWLGIEGVASAMPSTVFTLNVVRSSKADTSVVSALFCHIAHAVHKDGWKAKLMKTVAKDTFNRVSSGGCAETTLRKLLDLFEDKEEIKIVDVKKDSGLEKVLNKLAEAVSSALSKANASVVVPKLNYDMRKLCGQDRVVPSSGEKFKNMPKLTKLKDNHVSNQILSLFSPMTVA